MKFLKIVFFTFILISSSNANTIFYLIKIPNLEIYDDTAQNGLKYLKAIKPFQVGIRDNNVSCLSPKKELLEKKYRIIRQNLDKYSYDFLEKINFKYVVLCKNLSVGGIEAVGFSNPEMKTILINIGINTYDLGRISHHELFHIINENFKNIFNEIDWKDINEDSFLYSECSTCSENFGLDLIENQNGFLSEYSKSTPSEDMAEIFSFLMTRNSKIATIASSDKIIRKKINFIKDNIYKIDKNFKF